MQRNGDLAVYYAPVEWVNPTAKLVLVDTTPWEAQADNALSEANRTLREGAHVTEVLCRRISRMHSLGRHERKRSKTALAIGLEVGVLLVLTPQVVGRPEARMFARCNSRAC